MPAEGGSRAKIRWKTILERLREGQRQEGGLVFEKQKEDKHGQSMVSKETVVENENREVGRAQSHRAWGAALRSLQKSSQGFNRSVT